MNAFKQAIWAYITAHKAVSTVVAIVALGGLWYAYGAITSPSTAPRYVTTIVATSTVVATMSETGQVSASSNIDVLSKSSGEVLSIPVTAGQHVQAGATLAYLDSTTALQNVTSAKQSLQSAQISLASAQANLAQAHDSGYSDVSATFLNLPSVITGLDAVLHGSTVPSHPNEQNVDAYNNIAGALNPAVVQYRDTAKSTYQKAIDSYNKASADFKSTLRTADTGTIDTLARETYNAVQDLSDALRASTNYLDLVNTTLVASNTTVPTSLATHASTLAGYTTTTNGYVTTLSNDVSKIGTSVATSVSADPLNIQSSELSVQMKQDALAIALQSLSDTVVRAPFSGTVGKLNVQHYQTIGSGVSVATLVSDNQSVNISVNEVDAAKLKVGEKATITFDALPTISIAGTVSSVNTIGTVSSGVVSYSAVVTFDTPNPNVKVGMSATTDIITGTETGLALPQSAVKTANGQSYVQVFNPPDTPPTRTNVTVGLSSDTEVIIRSGISAGAQVVTQTITGAAALTAPTSATRSTSLFPAGGGASGGGAVRALTR